MINSTFWIWPEDGICDLPDNWASLALPSVQEVGIAWAEVRASHLSNPLLKKFDEELAREWSIETGIVEDLYEIEQGVTVNLIQHGFNAANLPHAAVNRDPEDVLQILRDQQLALQTLFDFVKGERALTVGYIRELQALITRSQETYQARDQEGRPIDVELKHGEFKKQANHVVRSGVLYRYCEPIHVESEMDRLVGMHEIHRGLNVPAEVEAAWLHHRFTQIHPFPDGNGRVARLLATLVLIRAGLFPFVVERNQKAKYIMALEQADNNDLQPFIYFIAIDQQVRLRRAQVALARSGGPSQSVEEAATRYFAANAATEVVHDKLRQDRAAHVAGLTHAFLQEMLKPLSSIKNPGHSVRYGVTDGTASEVGVRAMEVAGIDRRDPLPRVIAFTVRDEVATKTASFVIDAPSEDPEGRVLVVAVDTDTSTVVSGGTAQFSSPAIELDSSPLEAWIKARVVDLFDAWRVNADPGSFLSRS